MTKNIHATPKLVPSLLAVQAIDELRRIVQARLLIATTHSVCIETFSLLHDDTDGWRWDQWITRGSDGQAVSKLDRMHAAMGSTAGGTSLA